MKSSWGQETVQKLVSPPHWGKNLFDCNPWSHGLQPKKLYTSVVVTPAPVQVPTLWPLVPSFMSVIGQARTFHLVLVNYQFILSSQHSPSIISHNSLFPSPLTYCHLSCPYSYYPFSNSSGKFVSDFFQLISISVSSLKFVFLLLNVPTINQETCSLSV